MLLKCVGRLSLRTSQVAHQTGACPNFCSMKQLGVFLLPPWLGCSLSQGYPQTLCSPVTHLYILMERGTVRVKYLAQEHNTMSLARAKIQTTLSGDERTNYEAATTPTETSPTKTYEYKEFP